jgi:hypothetical protein
LEEKTRVKGDGHMAFSNSNTRKIFEGMEGGFAFHTPEPLPVNAR